MTERISSPEQLSRRLKFNKAGIWVALITLTVAVIAGLILFLSRDIVIRETHLCYVTNTTGSSKDMLYELFMSETNKRVDITREKIEETYGKVLSPESRIVYFFVRDMEETEIAEGMNVMVGNSEGIVVSIPNEMTDYEHILESGLNEEEMRQAGLMPGISYYLITAFLSCDGTEAVMEPGFNNAEVILNVLNPVSMILK